MVFLPFELDYGRRIRGGPDLPIRTLVLLALIGTSLFAAAEILVGRVVAVADGDTI
jgi:hypothetical protein